jgi:HK97 family phage major capsid protein/HK97 family phage prohead protease
MERAYTTFEIKALVDAPGKKRTFTGIASTPTVDRMDDIVEPKGLKMKLPFPLLWQHNARDPIGWVVAARVTDKGVEVDCEVASVDEPGPLQDRLTMAWQMLKAKLVQGLSIGFNALETARIEGTYGVRYLAAEVIELSTVTVPANADCGITAIKSIDREQRAALGLTQRSVVRLGAPPPGVSGTKAMPAQRGLPVSANPKGTEMKTIAERIADFKAKKAENEAKLTEMVNKSLETGETLDAEAKDLRKSLTTENAEIDEHITMLTEHEALMAKSAKPAVEEKGAPASRGTTVNVPGSVIAVKSNLPKGIGFARLAQAMITAKGNLGQAADIAKRWTDDPRLATVMGAMANVGNTNLKAAVAVGDSNTSGWASQLVYYNDLASEFYGLLYPKTIIGRIPGLRRIPFNVRIGGTSSGTSSAWVGEGTPIAASAMAFTSVTLGHSKAASLVVMTRELATMSNPQAEMVVRDDILSTMTKFADQQFIDPAIAASANVSPASITNGAASIASSGSTVAAIYTDVSALKKLFIAAELDMAGCVWVMKPATALDLSMKRTSQDIAIFPDITMDGGTWFGLPVVTSNSVPGSVSGGSIIALVKADEVYFADDGGITMDYTTEASVQMLTNPSTGAQSLVSLFQNDLVGLRAVREMNWQRRRSTGVVYLDGVSYI